MKTSNDHVLRNRLQNAAIIILMVSAFMLLLQTKLLHTDFITNALSSVSKSSVTSINSSNLQINFPVQIALRSGNEGHAWLNESTEGETFEDFGALLSEALSSAENAAAIKEDEFRRVLENDCIYYDFTVTIPLPLLAERIGILGSCPNVSARSLVLSGVQKETLFLYAWDSSSDSYFRWSTAISADRLTFPSEKYHGIKANFAFLCDAPYNALAPYTLVSHEPILLQDISSASAISASAESALLTALDFNIHSNSRYPESNGAEVVVQGVRTLRIAPDGTVTYNGENEIIPDLSIQCTEEQATLSEAVQGAWRFSNTLLDGYNGNFSIYLTSVVSDRPGHFKIHFGYTVGGYPVVFPDGSAAEFTIENNQIQHFKMHLRQYTSSEKVTALMPILQAASTVPSDRSHDLYAGYFDDGSEQLSPAWLQETLK